VSTSTKQQFEGTTIEEALATAVSVLGDDLEILGAERVMRRRPLGVRRRERFEVTATKRVTVEPKGFEDVLRRMVDRVDEEERQAGAELADSSDQWWPGAEFVLPEEQFEPYDTIAPPRHGIPDGDFEVDVRVEPARARRAAPEVVTERAREVFQSAVGAPAHASVVVSEPPVEVESDSPSWSVEGLAALELPSALVGRISAAGLHTDIDWIAALTKAISELLQLAGDMSGPCELTGHGAESAVHLIRGACDGFRLDSLIIDDRRVPATPLELALAIRSLLRDQ